MDPRENQMRAAMGFFILALAGLALSVSMSAGCRAAEGQETAPGAEEAPTESGAADQETEPSPGTTSPPGEGTRAAPAQADEPLIMVVPRVPRPTLVPLPAEDPPLLIDPPMTNPETDSPTAPVPPATDQPAAESSAERPTERRTYFAPPGETTSIEEPAVVSPLVRAAEIAERERAQAERGARSRK
jgi:septal ring-binding cell division protein DamX